MEVGGKGGGWGNTCKSFALRLQKETRQRSKVAKKPKDVSLQNDVERGTVKESDRKGNPRILDKSSKLFVSVRLLVRQKI